MADFWCFLWMFSKDFSPGDGIRIVTAMTPNGSLDPWKFIVRHVNRHSFPSPRSLKWQDASLGIFTSKSIQNPAKSSKNLQQKIPRWRCFFWLIFYFAQKCLLFISELIFFPLRVFRSWPRSSITSTFESWRVRSYTTSTSSNSSNRLQQQLIQWPWVMLGSSGNQAVFWGSKERSLESKVASQVLVNMQIVSTHSLAATRWCSWNHGEFCFFWSCQGIDHHQ